MPKSGYAYRQYLPDRIESTFYLTPTTTNEILVEIRKLNPRKSCGPDNIGGKIVKLCPDIFAENLSIIYNKSIEVGQYPTLMKIAKVIALFKKGNRCHASNYRPISLLSIFNKIFEKVLCKRLVTFLENYVWLSIWISKTLFDLISPDWIYWQYNKILRWRPLLY